MPRKNGGIAPEVITLCLEVAFEIFKSHRPALLDEAEEPVFTYSNCYHLSFMFAMR